MRDDERTAAGPKIGAGIVAPINRVNLAFPFSKISIQESSRDLAELSAIVAELLAVLEETSSGELLAGLRQRALSLVTRPA